MSPDVCPSLVRPDFSRVVAALQHEEADRVPLAEVAIDYCIMSQFLGKPVAEDDLVVRLISNLTC